MKAGFWPSNYFPANYFAEDYWPDYVAPVLPRYAPTRHELAISEYLPVGKFRVETWRRGPDLQLTLKDWKTRLEVEAPQGVFLRGELDEAAYTYPNLDEELEGKPVPFAFGRCFDLPCKLIDTEAKKFKVLGHGIQSFDQIRANGAPITPTTTDLSKAEFTWADWVDEDLSADIVAPYSNPVDAIEQLLTSWGSEDPSELLTPTGISDPDYKRGFGAYGARLSYIVGHTRDGVEECVPELSLYVAESTPVLELVERVCSLAFARFYYDPAGYYFLDAWAPARGVDAVDFSEHEIFDLDVETSNPSVLTRLVVKFGERHATSGTEALTLESARDKALRNLPAHQSKEYTLPTPNRRDARWWASRLLAQLCRPQTTYTAMVNQRGWVLRPGDAVRMVYPKRAVDAVFEVLAVESAPGTGKVKLTLGENRGLRDRPGFWCEDSPAFPATLGGGSAATWTPGWSDAQKKYVRENLGYWQDDQQFNGTPKDKASYQASVWV